jgi:beta-phosphoglucomutase-like phosphatase (HAD superfamily)
MLFSAEMVARGKPAPDLFLYAAAQMGVTPARCFVVEDSLAGVTAARAAGMTAIGFCGGGHCRPGHDDRLRACGAVQIVYAMNGLAEAISGSA